MGATYLSLVVKIHDNYMDGWLLQSLDCLRQSDWYRNVAECLFFTLNSCTIKYWCKMCNKRGCLSLLIIVHNNKGYSWYRLSTILKGKLQHFLWITVTTCLVMCAGWVQYANESEWKLWQVWIMFQTLLLLVPLLFPKPLRGNPSHHILYNYFPNR